MHDLLPLVALRSGQVAEVRQLAGAAEQVRRLRELGLGEGSVLEVVRGGRPCIVRIANTTLSFRDGELVSVLVAVRKSA